MPGNVHATPHAKKNSERGERVLFYLMGAAGLGHLSRALALSQALRQIDPETQILFIAEPADMHLASDAQVPYINVAPLVSLLQQGPWEGLAVRRRLALWQALLDGAMEAFCPTIVIHDTYVVGPVKKAADRLGARQVGILRHSPWAEKIRTQGNLRLWQTLDLVLVPHLLEEYGKIVVPGLPEGRLQYVGNIVRRSTSELRPEQSRQRYTVRPNEFVVVATNGGGNLPATTPSGHERSPDAFLQTVLETVEILRRAQDKTAPFRVILITGPLATEDISLAASGERHGVTFSIHKYEPFLPELMASAQVVICRGGYNTLNEVIASGVPAIAIPIADLHDPDEPRIAWACTQKDNMQEGLMDAEDLARRLLLLQRQPWWHFTLCPPEKDLLLQGKLKAAELILETTSSDRLER